jgi:hypothetical protein
VKEALDPEFTIIRSETFAYPYVLYPAKNQLRPSWNDIYDQVIHITVPGDYVVVNSGDLSGKEMQGSFLTYHFKSNEQRRAMIIPIAKYEILRSQNHRIYFFSVDRKGAEMVASSMEKASALLTAWFGALKTKKGISLVEIPDGFGSQTDFPLIIQTAAAFKDPEAVGEVYHELSHLWNPEELEKEPPRWNEGLAMFLQGLIQEQLDSPGASAKLTAEMFRSFQKRLQKNNEAQTTPMKDYGSQDMTDLSYTGGGVFFALVYELLGSQKFLDKYRSFYNQYADKGATTEEFLTHLESSGKPLMKKVVRDWFRTANYVPIVLSAKDFNEIVSRYKQP